MSKTSGFFAEFREFAVKGNMIDLAVGVIIGAAFAKIIASLVEDVIMPVVSFIIGGSVDFTNHYLVLSVPADYAGPDTYAALTKAGAVLLGWGNFLTVLINFILLALVVFCLVKLANNARNEMKEKLQSRAKAQKQEQAQQAPPAPAPDIVLLAEIRDLLRTGNSGGSAPPAI